MKKRVLILILTFVFAYVALMGCGKKDKNDSGTQNDGQSNNNSNVEIAKVNLTVWSPAEDQSAGQGKWLQTMCEEFNAAHPEWDITFRYGVCPEGEAKNTVTQDVEGAADVYMFSNDNLPALVSANAIARLGGETADYVTNTNSAAIVDSVSYNGNIYGVPFTTNTWFMYYDTSVFSEEEASNLDTMLSKAKVAFPLSNSWYLASFYVANGCTFFGDGTDAEAGIDFTGDKAVAVTEYLVKLASNKNFVNDAAGEGLAGLRDGSISAMFSGSWDYMAVKDALGDRFGAKELPSITIDGEEKQLMAFAGSKAIAVNPSSKNIQAAVALAKFLGGAKAQLLHYELRGIVPCNNELLANEDIAADTLVVAQNSTFNNTSIIQPFVDEMGNYWVAADNFGKSLVNGEVTLKNAESKTEAFNGTINKSGI